MKKYTRYIVFIVGILILTLGVAITKIADVGIGSWDALNFGLSDKFGSFMNITLTVGNWMMILSLGALILAAILNKGVPKIVSFITVMLVGKCIDLWVYILRDVHIDGTILRYVTFFVGILITSFGIAMYLLPRLPENPVDHLMMTIKEKFNMKVMYAKLLIDGTCIVVALFIGGPIGIGTILATVMVGPLVDVFINMIKGTYEKLTGESDEEVSKVLDLETNV